LPIIVDDKQLKIITEYNCARQERKSLKSLHPDTNDNIQPIQQLHNNDLQNQPENSGYVLYFIFTDGLHLGELVKKSMRLGSLAYQVLEQMHFTNPLTIFYFFFKRLVFYA